MAKELLLEIGTEEIPAAFIPKALKDMERIITKEFSENRIGHGRIKTMGTPRRLLLSVKDVDERQEDQLLEKVGPSTKVAFDEGGKPTKAAIGFARGQGIDVSELEIIETPKGKPDLLAEKNYRRRHNDHSDRSPAAIHYVHPLPEIDALDGSGYTFRETGSLDTGSLRG